MDVEPSSANGLRQPAQIVIDTITAVPAPKIVEVIGPANDALLLLVNGAIAAFLGIV